MTRDDATRTCERRRRRSRSAAAAPVPAAAVAEAPPQLGVPFSPLPSHLLPPASHLELVRGLLDRRRDLDVEGEDAGAHIGGALHVLVNHLAMTRK